MAHDATTHWKINKQLITGSFLSSDVMLSLLATVGDFCWGGVDTALLDPPLLLMSSILQ